MSKKSRREFLNSSLTAACAAGLGASAFPQSLLANAVSPSSKVAVKPGALLPVTKGLWMGMLPSALSVADRFKLAKDVGFEVVQAPTTPEESKAAEIKQAADAAKIRIDSVMNMAHWEFPLSSDDPAAVEKSLAGMRTSLHNAKLWGSDTVLLGSRRGESQDFLQGRLDAFTRADPQAASPCGRTQSRHRDGRSLEQISAKPARDEYVH